MVGNPFLRLSGSGHVLPGTLTCHVGRSCEDCVGKHHGAVFHVSSSLKFRHDAKSLSKAKLGRPLSRIHLHPADTLLLWCLGPSGCILADKSLSAASPTTARLQRRRRRQRRRRLLTPLSPYSLVGKSLTAASEPRD